jgi:hypothetical protein
MSLAPAFGRRHHEGGAARNLLANAGRGIFLGRLAAVRKIENIPLTKPGQPLILARD